MIRPGHKVKQLAENRTLPGAPDLRQGKPKRADNIRQAALVKLEGRGRLATAGWKKRSSWDSNRDRVTDPGAGMARNYAHGEKAKASGLSAYEKYYKDRSSDVGSGMVPRRGAGGVRLLNERRQSERVADPGAALVSMTGKQRVGWGGGATDVGESRQWRKERGRNVLREGEKVIGARTWRPLESRLRFDSWSDAELRPVAVAMIAGAISTPGSMVAAVGGRLEGEQMLLFTDAQWRVFLQWAGWTAQEAARLVRVGLSPDGEMTKSEGQNPKDGGQPERSGESRRKNPKVERRVA